MFIDCLLRALEVSWLYVTLIAIVFIIIIIIIITIITLVWLRSSTAHYCLSGVTGVTNKWTATHLSVVI